MPWRRHPNLTFYAPAPRLWQSQTFGASWHQAQFSPAILLSSTIRTTQSVSRREIAPGTQVQSMFFQTRLAGVKRVGVRLGGRLLHHPTHQ